MYHRLWVLLLTIRDRRAGTWQRRSTPQRDTCNTCDSPPARSGGQKGFRQKKKHMKSTCHWFSYQACRPKWDAKTTAHFINTPLAMQPASRNTQYTVSTMKCKESEQDHGWLLQESERTLCFTRLSRRFMVLPRDSRTFTNWSDCIQKRDSVVLYYPWNCSTYTLTMLHRGTQMK